MALWSLHGNGSLTPGGVVKPNERLSWDKTIGIGAQHVIAMFGATFLVPLLTGFPPATTLFFSAIGTVTFLLITGNRLPSYLGSSFAFIAPIAAATSGPDGSLGKALFGVLAAGLLLALVGLLVHFVGPGWIEKLMPSVVVGTIVMLIGFNLAPAAWNNVAQARLTALITILAILLITVFFKGLIGRLSILLGVIVGYIAALLQGQVDFTAVKEAAWFGLPQFQAPEVDFAILGLFLPVVLVLVAENVGHVKSVALMTDTDLNPLMGRALFADGLATMFAGAGGGSGTTTYAENIGVMAATKIYSTAVYWVAAAFALALSLIPKFGALIFTIPAGVLGGAGTVLYGMIGMLGARIWVENKVNFSSPVNLLTAAVALVAGIANFSFEVGGAAFEGIAIGSIGAIAVYHLMRVIAKWRGTDLVEPASPTSHCGKYAPDEFAASKSKEAKPKTEAKKTQTKSGSKSSSKKKS
ncbi:MAG: NCS2 family nucleobase:cation symporter [Propionibacteriaceae bacterium]|jgi:uracil-xanthine permease|nr:NCS2 family nucleobase:cation symporter [Propionibacteriaceae bacterium]